MNTVSEFNKYANLGMIARQLVDGFITGLHRSPYHGFSVEFADHKPYNFGESTKHIDWKVFSRTDKLYTKQYEEETNLRCRILVDNSASMHYPNPNKDKLRFAIYAAASLSYLLTKQRDVVGLSIFSGQIDLETELRSTQAHLHTIFSHLEDLPAKSAPTSTDIAGVLHQVAQKSQRRSLIILLTDMFQSSSDESLFNALQHLKHKNHEVIVFHISDYARELRFEFEDRPHLFVDLETKQKIKVNPYELKATYSKNMMAFHEQLKIKCGMMKVDFVPVDSGGSFDKLFSAYLLKRKKIR